MHESTLHTNNIFVTLTYDNDHLPSDLSLNKKHLQDFWKKLRKTHGKFRYYACGEYGEQTYRPHYHAIIFGLDFDDKEHHTNYNGSILYKSETLNERWDNGHCLIGSVTFDSCAYVARYIMKKTLGKGALEKYTTFNKDTGEIYHEFVPEFTTMSRKPGIAGNWIKKYKNDVYQLGTDGLIIQPGGVKFIAPKFYDNYMEKIYGSKFIDKVKARRLSHTQHITPDNSLTRLAVKQKIKLAQIKSLTRTL